MAQILLSKGRYRARQAETPADVATAQELRTRAFGTGQPDRDRFDDHCAHVLVEDLQRDAQAVCCFRILTLADGSGIGDSCAAETYDLSALERHRRPMAELGRFCILADGPDADILRVAWGALTAWVDREGIEMLFGCASFPGTDPARHREALALLGHRHLAPARWRPGIKARETYRFDNLTGPAPNAERALRGMPPLLRSYLAMGGRVSDHAVIDRRMNTLHVFTGLELSAIPPARKRLLRVVAG